MNTSSVIFLACHVDGNIGSRVVDCFIGKFFGDGIRNFVLKSFLAINGLSIVHEH